MRFVEHVRAIASCPTEVGSGNLMIGKFLLVIQSLP